MLLMFNSGEVWQCLEPAVHCPRDCVYDNREANGDNLYTQPRRAARAHTRASPTFPRSSSTAIGNEESESREGDNMGGAGGGCSQE